MQSLDRILLATDFSGAAEDALAEARYLARTFGSELHFLHAIPALSDAAQGYEVVAARVEERLDVLRERLEGEGAKVAPRHLIRSGKPSDLILAGLTEVDADLVILGAGEKPTLERVLLGSTAERVLREAPRPVWLVPPGEDRDAVKRILCAVDGSEPAREALATAIFLARTFVSQLALLTVFPEGERPAQGPGSQVQSSMREFDLHAIDVSFLVREGDPAEQMVAAVAEQGADLLVLGSAGRTGFRRLLHGNTAEKVARLVPCSVLAVKPPRS